MNFSFTRDESSLQAARITEPASSRAQRATLDAMLGKVVACALLVASSHALKVCPALTRRGLVTKVVAVSVAISPLAAHAELKQASDGEVYKRADEGKLNTARVIERAKTGELVDGSSAS